MQCSLSNGAYVRSVDFPNLEWSANRYTSFAFSEILFNFILQQIRIGQSVCQRRSGSGHKGFVDIVLIKHSRVVHADKGAGFSLIVVSDND